MYRATIPAMSIGYDPVKDGLLGKFFFLLFGIAGVSGLVYSVANSNLFNTQAAMTINVTATTSLSSLEDGLIGHWTFDGPDVKWNDTATEIKDVSGGDLHGNALNGMTRDSLTAGVLGQAARFIGADYVEVGTNALFNVDPGEAKTFSIWIKNSSLPTTSYFYWKEGTCIGWSFNMTTTGRIVLRLRTSAAGCTGFSTYEITSPGSTSYSDDKWHHVVGIIDRPNTTMGLYIDGLFAATTTIDNTLAANGGSFRIGTQWDNSAPYIGSIDDVRVYDRVLTADEVYRLYNMSEGVKINAPDSQSDSLTKGLVGYWKFNDGSGTSATDSSGNANTGTLTNGPTWTFGKVNGGVDFDGIDDFMTLADPVSGILDFGASQDFTLSGWFNRDTFTTDDTILAKRNGIVDTDDGYIVYIDDATDKLTFEVSENSGTDEYQVESVSTFTTAGWHHFSVVWDDDSTANTEIYIDGKKDNGTDTGTITNLDSLTNALAYRIGAESDNNNPFDGSLDEIRVYNRALTVDEVLRLYRDRASSDPERGLVGHWTFDGSDVSSTTAYDRSGKGNNGVLTNNPTKKIGRVGQGLSFDGIDDRISYGNVSVLKPSFPFTVSAWVKGTSGVVFSNGKGEYYCTPATPYSDNYSGIVFYMNGGVSGGSGGGQSTAYRFERAASVSAADGQWHHIVAVLQAGNNINLYKDGALNNGAYDDGTATTIGYDTRPVLIGASYGCGYLYPVNGVIDDVRVYNRALSATEVKDLYQKGSGFTVQ